MDFIQNTADDTQEMLKTIGAGSVADLFADIPEAVRLKRPLGVPPGLSEVDLQRHMMRLAAKNTSGARAPLFVGAGYYDHFVPVVVDHLSMRSEYYTAYTPYQPEASQGTLQSIFEYQTMISDLAGLPVSNASVYDGATAMVEAALLARAQTGRPDVVVSRAVHPEYRATLATYMKHLEGKVVEAPAAGGLTDGGALSKALDDKAAAVIVQYPNFLGGVEDLAALAKAAQGAGALFVVVANPVALGLLSRPGDLGADVVCGEGQPLGCYIWYGGPGFGFFAVKQELLRRIPGRIVGQTKDIEGKRAFVLTLQTREQHIRREKATSNICTNQALMALRATIFMSTLGPSGLRQMANLCLQKAHYLADRVGGIRGWSLPQRGIPFFHEFVAKSPVAPAELNKRLLAKGYIGGYDLGRAYPELAGHVLFCATEKRTKEEIDGFAKALEECSR